MKFIRRYGAIIIALGIFGCEIDNSNVTSADQLNSILQNQDMDEYIRYLDTLLEENINHTFTPFNLSLIQFITQSANCRPDYIEIAINKGFELSNYSDPNKFATLLEIAINENNFACFKLLLKNEKIDVNAQTNMGNTVLHVAIVKNNIDIVKQILEQNPSIEIKNINNKTQLDFAKDLNVFFKNDSLTTNQEVYKSNEILALIDAYNSKKNSQVALKGSEHFSA